MTTPWQPSATQDTLRTRARVYQAIRQYFQARDFLEVETPVLGSAGTTDRYIQSFLTAPSGAQNPSEQLQAFSKNRGVRYLQTSPEFFMKRMLAAGFGPIYSLGKVFREEESGRFHNPEFTLLEWYQPGFDDRQLMDQVAELLKLLLNKHIIKISYGELFHKQLHINPYTADIETLAALTQQHIAGDLTSSDINVYLDLLFSHCIQPTLNDAIYFVYDYPASQAALAKLVATSEGFKVARRFEVFIDTVEIANGYWELTDASEQAARFQQDNNHRQVDGNNQIPADTALINALTAGMPPCAGVALGIDRLIMVMTGAGHIREVIAFDWERS